MTNVSLCMRAYAFVIVAFAWVWDITCSDKIDPTARGKLPRFVDRASRDQLVASRPEQASPQAGERQTAEDR
jgi:hypothetical protein